MEPTGTAKRYSTEIRERAVRRVLERQVSRAALAEQGETAGCQDRDRQTHQRRVVSAGVLPKNRVSSGIPTRTDVQPGRALAPAPRPHQ
jgi:transposase-like protein